MELSYVDGTLNMGAFFYFLDSEDTVPVQPRMGYETVVAHWQRALRPPASTTSINR